LFEISGKVEEMANGKYSENYASFWVAHNAMLSFLKTWERQNKWCLSFEDKADPILRDRKKVWSPEWGYMFEMGRKKRSLTRDLFLSLFTKHFGLALIE